ncbi:MAG: oxygenase MpaB family protein [Acidimicrobiia bacterium]
MEPIVEPIRVAIRDRVRGLVAGEPGRRTVEDLSSREDDGWYGADSPVRLIHADASMFPAGVRALLLQSLHPLPMAAVVDQSGFRDDPWGRLQRTAAFIARTTYGSSSQAAAACEVVRRVHGTVKGTTPDGRPYDASDPHLLEWVHVAEVDSFVKAHKVYGTTKLSAADYDRYADELARVAIELGVDDPPRTMAGVAERIDAFRPELEGTQAAREACRFLARPRELGVAAQVPYAAIFTAGAALLPAWARFMLRLPVFPVSERLLLRPVASQVLDVFRWATNDAPSAARVTAA